MQLPTVFRTAYRADEQQSSHAHEYSNVSLIIAGSLKERVGAAEIIAGPLSLVVKPAGTEHANTFGADGAILLKLPLSPEWDTEQEDGARAFERWHWTVSPAAARWMLRLSAGREAGIVSGVEAIAECLGALAANDGRERPAALPAWLLNVRERIRDESGIGASVENLAREAGVHPVYLTRRFRRAFGCSVVGYRIAQRVQRAARALGSGDERISHVAMKAGFSDQSHLTRVFHSLLGVTPAVYRSITTGGPKVGFVQSWRRRSC